MNTNLKIVNQPMSYADVPWARKSATNIWLAIAGFWIIPPLLWIVCFNCLTGDIYCKDVDENGNLKKWGVGSKIASIILVVINLAICYHEIYK